MALADRILTLKLVTDVSDLKSGVSQAEGRLAGLGRNVKSFVKIGALGAVVSGAELAADALGNAWTGFRDGEKAAGRLQQTWDNLKLGDDLQKRIDDISAAAKAVNFDDTAALDAFDKLTRATSDPEEAAKRLRIAMDLVASGASTDLDSAIKTIQQASNGSKRAVDTFGLTADDAAGRVDELATKVAGAAANAAGLDPVGTFFGQLNEDLEGIVGSLSTGDIDGAIRAIGDAGADAMGFLDQIGPKIQAFLDPLTGGAFGDFISGLQTFTAEVGPQVAEVFGSMFGAMQSLIGAVQNVITFLQPLIDALSPAVAGSLGFVLELTSGIFDALGKLLTGDFSGAIASVQETLGNLATIVSDTLNSVLTGLLDLVPNLFDAAVKIGQAIWNGIINSIRGIADRVATMVRDAVNGMIELWNSIGVIPAGSINLMSWGEQGIAGTPLHIDAGSIGLSWGSMDIIPNLPKLASGGIVNGPMIALLGEAGREAVVPLDHAGLGTTIINVTIQSGVGNPIEIGREVDRVLTAYRRRAGKPI